MSAPPSFADPAVAAVFETFPPGLRARLLELRALILRTAAETPRVGELVEALKWGEPAYRPKRPRTGTTLRIAAVKRRDDQIAAYFHCRTSLVEEFRQRYPGTFAFEGNRALVLAANAPLPAAELGHCIARALTYHLPPQGD